MNQSRPVFSLISSVFILAAAGACGKNGNNSSAIHQRDREEVRPIYMPTVAPERLPDGLQHAFKTDVSKKDVSIEANCFMMPQVYFCSARSKEGTDLDAAVSVTCASAEDAALKSWGLTKDQATELQCSNELPWTIGN